MKENKVKDDKIYVSTFLIELAKDYSKVLEVDTEYKCYFINDKLEIQEGYGYISNNGSYNYHNNYDTSENILYVKGQESKGVLDRNPKWWSLSLEKAKQKQRQLISISKTSYEIKLENLKKIEGVIIKLDE